MFPFFKKSSFEKVSKASNAIWKKTACCPDVGVILGTGLGNFSSRVKKETVIPYESIPFFPKTTALGHAGRMVFGSVGGRKVVVLDGRFHCYEGYSMEEVAFPVRVLKKLGVKYLIISNAAGGLNMDFHKGDLVLIKDHINLMGSNPLVGSNDERFGVRFPDMSQPYCEELLEIAGKSAQRRGISLKQGIYLGVLGPCLETRAEYRLMRNLGADLVGMSTVPEVIEGVHLNIKILAISVVTDCCDPDHLEPVSIEQIITVAREAGPKLDDLIENVIQEIPHGNR